MEMPVPKYRCIGPWTINNPTDEDFGYVRNAVNNGFCKYVVFCHENKDREGHTYHLQGFSSSSKGPYSMKKWHEILGPRFALDKDFKGVGHEPACIAYCKGMKDGKPKEGSGEVEEFGELKQGSRTDIHSAVEGIKQGKRVFDVICENPGAIQAYKALECMEREVKRQKCMESVRSEFDSVNWQPWQQAILDVVLKEPPCPRKVYWLYEEDGNVGKSYLTRYLASKHNAYCPDVTKIQDIYYAYNYEPIVIFDIPRAKYEQMDAIYPVLEQFKNGRFFSGKYQSQVMMFKVPHVIVFANFPPDRSKLSQDRWLVIPVRKT